MVYSSSMGHMKTRRITVNDLFGGTDNGSTKQLLISNTGTDDSGSIVIKAASGKTTGFTTSSNGAMVQLHGEVQIGSTNHAAQIFSHADVTNDLHIRSTNAVSGINLDPGSSEVLNTGNLALLGGDITGRDKRLTLFTEGTGAYDIYLDPRTNTTGGDVYARSNIYMNQTLLEGTNPEKFVVQSVANLYMNAVEGDLTLSALANGSVIVTSAQDFLVTPTGDVQLNPVGVGNLISSVYDATVDAANVATIDGAAGVHLVSAATVSAVAASNVEVTAGAALVETVATVKTVVAGTGISETATTGNVRLMASSDSIQLVAAEEIHMMSTGDVMVNATGNVDVTGVDYVVGASNTVEIDGQLGTTLTASLGGNVDLISLTDGFTLLAESGSGSIRVGSALNVESTTGDIAVDAGSNITTISNKFVGSHASGLELVSTQSEITLTTEDSVSGTITLSPATDIVSVVGTDVMVALDGTNTSTVVATAANLSLSTESTGTYVHINPKVATHTAMPLMFTSNTVNYHMEALDGPLRLRGNDPDNTTQVYGNLEVTGTLNYITANATTLMVEDKQLVLNQADISTDATADQAGFLVNGSDYEIEADHLSLLWNKTDSANAVANDSGSFWRFQGGDLAIARYIPELAWTSPFDAEEAEGYQTYDQFVEFRFAITGDEKLQVQKIRGRRTTGVDMAITGADKVVVAEFDLI